jgi:TonB family protein
MAPYTEAARQANVQGHVTLQVTMLASGGIGDITVLESLKEGLTESAIAAARRTVFLPKRVNGVPVTVTNNFQYGFNIY